MTIVYGILAPSFYFKNPSATPKPLKNVCCNLNPDWVGEKHEERENRYEDEASTDEDEEFTDLCFEEVVHKILRGPLAYTRLAQDYKNNPTSFVFSDYNKGDGGKGRDCYRAFIGIRVVDETYDRKKKAWSELRLPIKEIEPFYSRYDTDFRILYTFMTGYNPHAPELYSL